MKKNASVIIAALTVLALFGVPSHTWAQQPSYKLIDMGTLGGPSSSVSGDGNGTSRVLNNAGTLAGSADTSVEDPFPAFCFNEDCHVGRAFRWHADVRTDLGVPAPGLSSTANWISDSGLVAGGAENGDTDPLFAGLPETRGVLWRDRHISDLGTLPEGGYESWANAVNSSGQVVGWATNLNADLLSMAAPGFLPTQTRAFLWQHNAMEDLGTLGGTNAIAQFIDERGHIVGYSYTSSVPSSFCPFPLSTGSFVWDREHRMVNLGSFGGSCTIASAMNNRGQVVGESNGVGDQISPAFIWDNGSFKALGGSLGGDFSGAAAINDEGEAAGFAYISNDLANGAFHAALWKHIGDLTDLGILEGDRCSFASSINSKTQVVGASSADCAFADASVVRAFLWDNGKLFDLNALIPAGAPLYLRSVETINDRGEIAGTGLDVETGDAHAVLLIPCPSQAVSECRNQIASDKAALSPFAFARGPKHGSARRNSVRQTPPILPGRLAR